MQHIAQNHNKNMNNMIARLSVPVMAVLIAANAHATVTMTLSGATTYAENSGSFTATLNGNQIISGDDLIGIYSFSISPGSNPNISTPFYTTCLSPAGLLDWGTHTYDFLSFGQAEPGLNPPGVGGATGWAGANSVNGGYGIQNANYLFSTLSGQILSGGVPTQVGTVADQGAAMALSMYTALYDSTDYGTLGGAAFSIPGLGGNVLADYSTDLSDLVGAKVSAANGYVLRPDPSYPGAGQDMILLATGLPQSISAVPEPTTMIAGALMLLPFGASTLRILRRNRAA